MNPLTLGCRTLEEQAVIYVVQAAAEAAIVAVIEFSKGDYRKKLLSIVFDKSWRLSIFATKCVWLEKKKNTQDAKT